MASGMSEYIQKGIRAAEQATAADQAHNDAEATKQYMIAAEWLLLAVKSRGMDPKMKSSIRDKAKSYIDRAETLQKKTKTNEKSATPSNGGTKSPKTKNESTDEDLKRITQKFEGAIVDDPKVSFNDIVGLEQAKQTLKEAVIMPIRFPKLFEGHRKPWAGILLYGPPGTGKSYLAKALATECKSTFISVSSSDILSKWLGEAEKSVRCLFELARERRPCIIFIDEIDSLCGQRNDNQSEASGRVKTEFLVQMNGVGMDNSGVLVLAATNIPWNLDTAIRRRFEKRLYIPLPGVEERASMFKTHLGATTYHTIEDHEWIQLAEQAENYSGADIGVVCREALLRPIRRLSNSTHFRQVKNPHGDSPPFVWLACSPGDIGAKSMTLDEINPDDLCEPPVSMNDMINALATQRPTVGPADLVLHQKYTKEFGQDGS